jgi:hypothetical protein
VPVDPRLSAKAQASLGMPEGLRFYSPFPFSGMNVQSSPVAIDDKEFTYIENFLRIGDGFLRTAWDVGSALYTVPSGKTIVSFFFYNLGTNYYAAVFLSDGSAVQVNVNSGATVQIGPAGTFYRQATGFLPACAQWGTLYLLISNRNSTNDYWAWDGSLLYGSGSAAPNGVTILSGGNNYTGTPAFTAYGGHGSGMTFTATIQGGQVVQLAISNPGKGYQPNDVVQVAAFGGGTDATPILQALLTAGTIADIVVTNPGTSYTSAPTMGFAGGGGTGAAATAYVSKYVVSATQVSGGSGYSFATISFVPQPGAGGAAGAGSGASGVAVISGGVITGITILTGGSAYALSPIIIISGDGSGASFTSNLATGVTDVVITNTGSGYTSIPAVGFAGGGGSGTTAVAQITGTVVAANVTSNGYGYTTATVAFSGTGTGAAGTAVITNGAITAITITNGGGGYTSAPTITITGDGFGAGAQAVLLATGVASVQVVNPGSNLTVPPALTFSGGGGSGAAGTVLLSPMQVVRVDIEGGGANYQQAPTVGFYGGGFVSTEAAGTSNLTAGSVSSVTMTNGGNAYSSVPLVLFVNQSGDTTGAGATGKAVMSPAFISSVAVGNSGSGYTDAPAITIASGSNFAFYGEVDMMPFGVSGNSLETYSSRVWIANPAPAPYGFLPPGGNWSFSAAASLSDFATSDGGGLFTSYDGFLQTKYTAIRQSNGYLYFFGDGSASVISNIQTSGNPATTTFNYQNVDPQAGLSWRDSRQDFGRTIIFGNETGVYGLYGGAVTKVSSKLDQLFTTALFPPIAGALTPSAAVATLFNIKHYLMLMTMIDPDTLAPRNVMVTWNEKEWVVTSQSLALTYIGSQKVESKFQAWGTDGNALYPLFSTPSPTLTKRIDTKFYGGDKPFLIKDVFYAYLQAQDMSANGAGISVAVSFNVSGLALQDPFDPSVPGGQYNMLIQQPQFKSPYPYWAMWGSGSEGIPYITVGARMTTTSADFAISNLMISYRDNSFFG